MGKKTPNKVFENLEIIDAGAKGKAVTKAPDGKIVFVSNAVPGDVVTIETTKQRSGYYEGKVIAIHKKSERRTEPVCQHFEWCGGCKWQNMQYSSQIFFKEKEVIQNLIRLGHLELPETLPIVGCEHAYYYRNKMEFSFASKRWLTPAEIKKEGSIEAYPACGFHISGMWDKVLDIENCHLQAEPSNAIRNFIKDFAIQNNIPFFNPRGKDGLLRTLMIRMTSTGELMVLIQFFKPDHQHIKLLMQAVSEQFPDITSLLYVINTKENDTIYDQKVIVYKGREFILEQMEGLQFKINAKSFYQTNSLQAYELYKITRDFADLQRHELVFDLYTGTGTIAQFIAKKARKVVGIESVPEAIADAKVNAKLNGIDNVEFLVGDMKNVFNDDFLSLHGQPDVIITDPPRDGMHAQVVEQILKIAPEKVVYVSCNSATQARDLALMKEQYKIVKVQPVDMFPQTHHVENVVLLLKK
jgi:23S rRNA (uracil1939-C5)-methyltransferase